MKLKVNGGERDLPRPSTVRGLLDELGLGERPVVVACTLLPYDQQFELGATLGKAKRSVHLNHPNCAKFCILGGASCSARFI